MTLGKGHLMATLPLFGAAVVYNVWYFTKGDEVAVSRAATPPAAMTTSGPSVAGTDAGPVDPAQVPPVADVALDKLPAWRRDPFVDSRKPIVVAAIPVSDAAPAQPEEELVVSAIFTSADGRGARAKVNGRTVRVGDRVGSATIVEIQPKAIVVESPALGRRTIGPQRRAASTRLLGSAR